MSSQLVVRIDSELKEKISMLARSEGRSTSDLVRDLLKEYLEERDIGKYIDGLWERICSKLTEKGFGLNDIESVVSEVRKRSSR